MIKFDVYGHCGLAFTCIIHCECFRFNMGISMKTRVVQVRIVSIPMSPKCVDISVAVPKWLKTLQTQYRSVRRHVGTDAELVRTLRTQNAGAKMVRCLSVLIPKCLVTLKWWQATEIMFRCGYVEILHQTTGPIQSILNKHKSSSWVVVPYGSLTYLSDVAAKQLQGLITRSEKTFTHTNTLSTQ